jgi:hypothetical protein
MRLQKIKTLRAKDMLLLLNMIQKNIRFPKTVLCSVLLMAIGFINVMAQKGQPETEFKYLKNSDNSRTLTYSVKIKQDEGASKPAVGIPIVFKSDDNDELATVKTDFSGIAKYIVPASRELQFDADGKLKFSATIENNGLVETRSDEVSLKDIEIQMELKEVDSVKKVFIKAFELGPKGEKKPITKLDLNIYVTRMFSLLKVADGTLGDDGSAEIDFPSGLPGDSLGNLTVISRVEDNDDYANAEKREEVAWGKPVNYHIPRFQRALWTVVAPTWMIVTLTILLFGVWAHYVFVVYKLWKIKQESRRQA